MENKNVRKWHVMCVICLYFFACNFHPKEISHDTLELPERYTKSDSIFGKPINFYTNNKMCSPLAKLYYKNQFQIKDNDSTEKLLRLAQTNDITLRPFYFYCLNKILMNADGALAELVGLPAREFIEKYPNQFLFYLNNYPATVVVEYWVAMIGYSGFKRSETELEGVEVADAFFKTAKQNCKECTKENENTLRKLAHICYK